MVEQELPTPGSIPDIPVILDFVDVELKPLLGLEALDRSNLLVDNVTNHLWNPIITNKDPFRFEDIWKIKLVRKGDPLFVPLSTPIQLLYTMAQLRKLHKQFAHLSATKICDLLKTAVTRTITLRPLKNCNILYQPVNCFKRQGLYPKRYRVTMRAENT